MSRKGRLVETILRQCSPDQVTLWTELRIEDNPYTSKKVVLDRGEEQVGEIGAEILQASPVRQSPSSSPLVRRQDHLRAQNFRLHLW